MLVVQRLVFERVHIQSAKLNPLEIFVIKPSGFILDIQVPFFYPLRFI